jgi:hypothetical protein
MQHLGALEQDGFRLEVIRIRDTAVDGTDGGAGFVIVKTDAFRAFLRDDVEDIVRDRGMIAVVSIVFTSSFQLGDTLRWRVNLVARRRLVTSAQ